ncbi:hypothetical protein [Medusavirus stheno T3]|uniref:Uncharacterized protein n=1 Tax=Medusavirus stheno T3 TaxID=3069717 RepID=A0A7S7YFV2_9VIRU|nr:hypothetical protein QKU73_gp395 [Acanthamoeba castellanii medusavirus]QPB44380.1 hypothetical protein [Medusavirus stheno T3]
MSSNSNSSNKSSASPSRPPPRPTNGISHSYDNHPYDGWSGESYNYNSEAFAQQKSSSVSRFVGL